MSAGSDSRHALKARGLNTTFPESSRVKSTPAVYQQMSLADADADCKVLENGARGRWWEPQISQVARATRRDILRLQRKAFGRARSFLGAFVLINANPIIALKESDNGF